MVFRSFNIFSTCQLRQCQRYIRCSCELAIENCINLMGMINGSNYNNALAGDAYSHVLPPYNSVVTDSAYSGTLNF